MKKNYQDTKNTEDTKKDTYFISFVPLVLLGVLVVKISPHLAVGGIK